MRLFSSLTLPVYDYSHLWHPQFWSSTESTQLMSGFLLKKSSHQRWKARPRFIQRSIPWDEDAIFSLQPSPRLGQRQANRDTLIRHKTTATMFNSHSLSKEPLLIAIGAPHAEDLSLKLPIFPLAPGLTWNFSILLKFFAISHISLQLPKCINKRDMADQYELQALSSGSSSGWSAWYS